ncbi:MAG: PQQ-binding-like beta-propeller repeat protein, partial [Gemmatimonadales bacterium]
MVWKLGDLSRGGHKAGIVAAALIGVNAVACGGVRVEPPESEPRPWTTYLAAPTRAPSAHERLEGLLDPLWSEDAGKATVGPVAVGQRVVVAQASDRKLTAWDRATGARLWRQNMATSGASGPLFTAERVFAASGGDDGQVAAYDLTSGRRQWDRDVGPVVGTIAVEGGRVFAATQRGHLVALDATEGRIAWRRTFGGPLRAGVTALGANLLVAADDSLFLVSRYEGDIVASQFTAATVVRPPAVVPGAIVTASPAGVIAAYDEETLEPLWRVETGAAVFGSPAVARDTAFVTALDGTLWRIPLAQPAGSVV